MDSSKLLGGETPQVILLKLNTLNLHNIPEDSTGFVEDGLKLVKVDEHVTENENERILEEIFLSRQSGQMITVGTLHTCDLNFGYSIEDNEIILRVDDSLDINDIFEVN